MKTILTAITILTSTAFADTLSLPASHNSDLEDAALAINSFGLDVHRYLAKENPGANLLTSPYSLESALALALRGADGETLAEMKKVLRVSTTDTDLLEGLARLDAELQAVAQRSAKMVKDWGPYGGGPSTPVKISVANRLFGQKGFVLQKDYLDFASRRGTPFGELDFSEDTEGSRKFVNRWIADQTSGLIPDLIPQGGLTEETRLVIVNALYFKASW